MTEPRLVPAPPETSPPLPPPPIQTVLQAAPSVLNDSVPIRKHQRRTPEIVKIVVGGAVGLAAGWAVLFFGFGIDVFGNRNSAPIASKERRAIPKVSIPKVAIPKGVASEPKVNLPTREAKPEPNREESAEPAVVKPAEAPAEKVTPTVDKSKETIAVVRVAKMQIQRTPNNDDMPSILRGGTCFRFIEQPKRVDIALGELEMTVEQSGVVYLTADWNYHGNKSGGWYEHRLTQAQLIELGWEHVGRAWGPPDKPVELFKRHCTQGEVLRIRTNKYWPPEVYLPPPQSAEPSP